MADSVERLRKKNQKKQYWVLFREPHCTERVARSSAGSVKNLWLEANKRLYRVSRRFKPMPSIVRLGGLQPFSSAPKLGCRHSDIEEPLRITLTQ